MKSSQGWLPRGGGISAEIRMRKSWGWEGKMEAFQRKETYAKHPEVRGNRLQGGHLGDCKQFRTRGTRICEGNWQQMSLKSSSQ